MPSASTLRRMELSDVMVVAEWCVDVTALTFLGKSNEKLDLGGSLTCWILHSLRLCLEDGTIVSFLFRP